MKRLIGEYEIAIDAKGRCLLPAQLRKQFRDGEGDAFVLNRGFENCLNIYPLPTWEANMAKVDKLDEFDPKKRAFMRVFLNGATEVAVDSADRILIPKSLQEYAKIKKDVILICMNNRMELWDKEEHYKFIAQSEAIYADLGKEVMSEDPK